MSVHDQIAEKLAEKFNTEYKSHKGVDIVTKGKVIEVETKSNSLKFLFEQSDNAPPLSKAIDFYRHEQD